MGNYLKKEPVTVGILLKTIWEETSFEARQIAGKSIENFGPKNSKIYLNFISSVVSDLDNWSICDRLAMYGVEPIAYSTSASTFWEVDCEQEHVD